MPQGCALSLLCIRLTNSTVCLKQFRSRTSLQPCSFKLCVWAELPAASMCLKPTCKYCPVSKTAAKYNIQSTGEKELEELLSDNFFYYYFQLRKTTAQHSTCQCYLLKTDIQNNQEPQLFKLLRPICNIRDLRSAFILVIPAVFLCFFFFFLV